MAEHPKSTPTGLEQGLHHPTGNVPEPAKGPRELPEAAQRALAEAEQRRREASQLNTPAPKEVGGRSGPDPVRYGDWETGGIASDF
jgi:hypothetical protein